MGVTIFRFFQKYMLGILLANQEQRCAERFLTCLQTGYGGLSFAIRVYGAIQVGLTPVSALSATAGAANSY